MKIKQPRNYDTAYAGWLLACSAIRNVTKGERLLATLTPKEQAKALAHKTALQELYTARSS